MNSPERNLSEASCGDEDKKIERLKRAEEIKSSLNDTGYQDFLHFGLENKKLAVQLARDEAHRVELLNALERVRDEGSPAISEPPDVVIQSEEDENSQNKLRSIFKKLFGK